MHSIRKLKTQQHVAQHFCAADLTTNAMRPIALPFFFLAVTSQHWDCCGCGRGPPPRAC